MNRMELYVKKIVKGHGVSIKEEEDLFAEMLDHLKQIKTQYLNKGYSEEDAEKCAIYDFGEEKDLRNKIGVTINPFHKVLQGFIWIIAVIYTLIVCKILFIGTISRLMVGNFKVYGGVTLQFSEKHGGSLNIIPFRSIFEYIVHHNQYNLDVIINNLFGTMVLFVPFGVLLPLLVKKDLSFSRFLCITVLVGLALEVIQRITRLGIADIDDIFLYTVGSMIGFGFFIVINKGWNAWRIRLYEWKQIRH